MSTPLIFDAFSIYDNTLGVLIYPDPVSWNSKTQKLTYTKNRCHRWFWFSCSFLYVGLLALMPTIIILVRHIFSNDVTLYKISSQQLTILGMCLIGYGFTLLHCIICMFESGDEACQYINTLFREERLMKKRMSFLKL